MSATALAFTLMTTVASAQFYSDVQDNGPLHLKAQGTFFIQGVAAPVTGIESGKNPPTPGNRMINQMAVQFMKPLGQNGKKHTPIVFVHGGGLTANSWQTTPDGRMGWYEYFVRQGFDTYLADQVSRGRSGFDARIYQDVRAGVLPPATSPNIILTTDASSWPAYRFANCTVAPCYATATPFGGIKYPMNTLGVGNNGANLQFFNGSVPDLNATLVTSTPPGSSPAQMAELAKELGGAVLVGHSESSGFPTQAALQPASGCYPWTTASACKVKGIIQMETGCFGNLTTDQI